MMCLHPIQLGNGMDSILIISNLRILKSQIRQIRRANVIHSWSADDKFEIVCCYIVFAKCKAGKGHEGQVSDYVGGVIVLLVRPRIVWVSVGFGVDLTDGLCGIVKEVRVVE